MIDVVCALCKSKFRVKNSVPNPVSCKVCQTPIEVSQLRQRDEEMARRNAKLPSCPGCQKTLVKDAKFCVSCGTYTGDIWAAQASSFEAKEKLKEKVWWRRMKDWFVRW
ncbi:MAG: hypothetical protein U0929_03710 [Planctomycetaceae bacterium]